MPIKVGFSWWSSRKTNSPILQLASCYAYERKKYLKRQVQPGEGLVGEAYQEGRHIYLKKIPEGYVHITSGLGKSTPTALLVMPMKVNDAIEGVIELASFQEFQDYQIAFIQKVGENMAAVLRTLSVNETTKQLLTEAQVQAEEMKAQEEEMRQNMEELSATQEELARKEREYLRQIDELQRQVV